MPFRTDVTEVALGNSSCGWLAPLLTPRTTPYWLWRGYRHFHCLHSDHRAPSPVDGTGRHTSRHFTTCSNDPRVDQQPIYHRPNVRIYLLDGNSTDARDPYVQSRYDAHGRVGVPHRHRHSHTGTHGPRRMRGWRRICRNHLSHNQEAGTYSAPPHNVVNG